MADPTGLISLCLGIVKNAVKHGATVRSRKRYLKALPYAIDIASGILQDAEQSADPVTRAAHQEVLGPCISEAEQFLKRVEDRTLFASTINKFGRADIDVKELKRLLSALDGAQDRVQARILELRVSFTHTQQNNEILVRLDMQQSKMQSIAADVARFLRYTLLSVSFFR